jgi:hypothetical protein
MPAGVDWPTWSTGPRGRILSASDASGGRGAGDRVAVGAPGLGSGPDPVSAGPGGHPGAGPVECVSGVRGAFTDAAKKASGATTTQSIAPLPTSDRTGAVVGLLLLPTLIGGYVIATLLYAATQRAAAPGRIAIILGFSIVIALITGASAGLTGAVPWSNIWTLLPCFALVTAAVALAGVAIQHFAGKYGTLLIGVLFIVIGGSAAGGIGVSLLSNNWQTVGALFPPRHAVDLYRNVRYFDGSKIATPIAVLAAYALAGVAIILVVE